jgi:hypothetical protein
MATNAMVTDSLRLGIDYCRRGDWTNGLRHLGQIAELGEAAGDLPGIFYSYLGYGIALKERRIRDGLKLCQHSIQVEFYQAENYLNLARTYLLAGDRKGAVKAVRGGLQMDRGNAGLLALYRELGMRQRPVLSFLSRSNPLNQLLGRLRHALRAQKE